TPAGGAVAAGAARRDPLERAVSLAARLQLCADAGRWPDAGRCTVLRDLHTRGPGCGDYAVRLPGWADHRHDARMDTRFPANGPARCHDRSKSYFPDGLRRPRRLPSVRRGVGLYLRPGHRRRLRRAATAAVFDARGYDRG